MKNARIVVPVLALAVLCAGSQFVWSDASPTKGNSETNASDRNFDTNQPNSVPGAVQKTNDGANRALNKVDVTTHKVIRKTKSGAHKTSEKTKDAYDKATEPAIKPEH